MSDFTRENDETMETVFDLSRMLDEAQREISEEVSTALSDRYGTEFSVCRLISDPGIGRVRFIMRGDDDAQTVFFAEMTGNGTLSESYVRAMQQNTLRGVLGEALPLTEINVAFPEDTLPETDIGLSLPAYVQKHQIRRVLVRIAAEEDTVPERSMIVTALRDAGRLFGVRIAASVFVLPHVGFLQCRQMFRNLPTVPEALIRSCEPTDQYTIPAGSGGEGDGNGV